MMRLIDADALRKAISEQYDLGYGEILINPRHFDDMVEDAPTVDDVKRGKWIYDHFTGMHSCGVDRPNYKCSVCGDWTMKRKRPFCPNCGAKMEADR